MTIDARHERWMTLADTHTVYEFTHEIEPLMATVHPEPLWVMEPIGCEIASREGVSQMYQRMFPLIGARPLPVTVNSWFSEDGFLGEVASEKPAGDGGTAPSSQFAWCRFTGELMSGECNYFDLDDVRYVAGVLGEDFFRLGGVTMPSQLDAAIFAM